MERVRRIILGARKRPAERFVAEVCDGCLNRVWVAFPVRDALDAAEEDGEVVELLCPRCAIDRYGPLVIGAISDRVE